MMSEHEDQNSSRIKVVDRRRFDADGQARDDRVEPEPPALESVPKETAPRAESTSEETPTEVAEGLDFMTFVASLATNAMAAMGVLPDAEKHGMPKNRELAHEYIEILAMLHEKTQGNLNPQEEAGMQRILSELRMAYVQTS
jgi:hypothetical protein